MKKFSIKNKKRFAIIICMAIAVILIILASVWYFKNNKKITTNMQFEYFGLNEYYENDSNELTINEAGKVLTSLYAKVYDISEIMETDDGLGLGWQNYAYSMNLISNEEYLNSLTYIRLFELVYDYEKTFRNVEENITNTLNIDTKSLSVEQINAINYLYNNEIILENDTNIDNLNNKVSKEFFENMIVKCIVKFNLLNLTNDSINYESSLNISQSSNYFYTTNNIDKNVLNKNTLKIDDYETYLTIKETYRYVRNDLDKISELINSYFDVILNVDYNTVSESMLYNNLKGYALIDYIKLEEYTNFVKENNIKITGNSNVIYPIIYFADGYYYVRTKINYEVISSNTNDNILFGNISNSTKCIDVKINKDVLGWHISTTDMTNLQVK